MYSVVTNISLLYILTANPRFHKKQMLKSRDRDSSRAQVGFLLGHSGVYAVHAVISRELGDVQGANENLAAFAAIKVGS